MKNTKLTHNGTKVSTFVQTNTGAEFYFSRPITSKSKSFVNITGENPKTGERNQVRLTGREIRQLLRTIGVIPSTKSTRASKTATV